MPSNIIIKSDSSEPVNVPYQMNQTEQIAVTTTMAQTRDRQEKSFAPASELVNRINIDFKKLQSFKDVDCSKWHILYLAKLKACHRIADFSDSKKDTDLKDQKKECLIEIIDVLDEPEAAEYIIKERVLEAAMLMLSANLFRTFANKNNKKASSVDPDEDEPHLEEAWPHLQLVYELLLKFILTPHLRHDIIVKHIS